MSVCLCVSVPSLESVAYQHGRSHSRKGRLTKFKKCFQFNQTMNNVPVKGFMVSNIRACPYGAHFDLIISHDTFLWAGRTEWNRQQSPGSVSQCNVQVRRKLGGDIVDSDHHSDEREALHHHIQMVKYLWHRFKIKYQMKRWSTALKMVTKNVSMGFRKCSIVESGSSVVRQGDTIWTKTKKPTTTEERNDVHLSSKTLL